MIVEYIRYTIGADRAERFRDAYARAVQLLQAEPNCLSYELARCIDDPESFMLRIEWSSVEGLDAFLHSTPFAEYRALVGPFGGDLTEMRRYEVALRSPALPEKGLPSLYEWAGGEPAIASLVNAFYDRVQREPLFHELFPDGVGPAHREHVTAWWSEVLGGPAMYTPIGGYQRMVAHHLDLNISPEQRRSFVALLSIAADEAGLPDDPEFRAAIIGYVEWGSRLALHNSQPGANVVREAPVPRWGWGVAPPYLG
jgi:hemoglobin